MFEYSEPPLNSLISLWSPLRTFAYQPTPIKNHPQPPKTLVPHYHVPYFTNQPPWITLKNTPIASSKLPATITHFHHQYHPYSTFLTTTSLSHLHHNQTPLFTHSNTTLISPFKPTQPHHPCTCENPKRNGYTPKNTTLIPPLQPPFTDLH